MIFLLPEPRSGELESDTDDGEWGWSKSWCQSTFEGTLLTTLLGMRNKSILVRHGLSDFDPTSHNGGSSTTHHCPLTTSWNLQSLSWSPSRMMERMPCSSLKWGPRSLPTSNRLTGSAYSTRKRRKSPDGTKYIVSVRIFDHDLDNSLFGVRGQWMEREKSLPKWAG